MKLNRWAHDVVLVYERHRVPNFSDLGHSRFICIATSYAQKQSLRIRVRHFQTETQGGGSNSDKLLQDSAYQFWHDEIPKNSSVMVVGSFNLAFSVSIIV